MAKVDILQVNVWEARFAADDHLAVTRFQISANAQETLTQWSREKAGRNDSQPMSVILRGLSELTAWFVPEIAFLRPEFDGALQRTRLSFYFTGDMTLQPGLRQRMQMALQLWVNTLYPEKAAEMRTQVAATALIDDGWTLCNVACALEPGGACPTARDSLFWDALAAHAAQRLAGQSLQFASGESRVLIPRTSQSSAFEGLELVAFPPKRGANSGLWSEVITLHAATFPERGHAHVLARPSIRNWGSITRYASRQAPRRSLDVFLPAEDAFGHANRRHTSFQFQARRGPDCQDGSPPGVVAYWPHKDGEKIFDLLRRLTNQSALAPDELASPVVDQEGLWILPRLASLHKDKFLPGGTGISWPDRKDIGDSLDHALAGGGFTRAEPLTRHTTRHKIQRTDADQDSARSAVIDALVANGGSPELSFYIFHIGEATPERVARLLIERFGSPDERDGGDLKWSDGFVIRLRSVAAGVLSEELPLPDLTADEKQGRNDRQLRPMREMKREEARDAVVAAMAAHIAAARQGDHGIACGLVEMPKALRDNPKQDPFQFTRRELARHDILPQVILWDTRTEAEPKTPPPEGKEAKPKDEDKYAAAVRDCFRMLGVLPIELLPDVLSPAALTIVQRNAEQFGLGTRASQAIPLAVRVRGKLLECATPDENGAPRWSPYARAALRIFQGDYGKFGRGKQAENLTRYHEFFATVLDDINRAGPALVIAEGEKIRHKVDAFANRSLAFDDLRLGGTTLTPQSTPNLRLVRVSPDADRQPFYYHEDDNKWPSGLFDWNGAARTFYALKTKPASVSHPQSFASMVSRHGDEGSNINTAKIDVDRVSSQIDEVCVMFMQPGDDAVGLATMTHRLRGAHVQTRVDTASPFPLHELRLLVGGITF